MNQIINNYKHNEILLKNQNSFTKSFLPFERESEKFASINQGN